MKNNLQKSMMEKNQKKTKRNGVLWGIALGLCALNTQAQTDGQVLTRTNGGASWETPSRPAREWTATPTGGLNVYTLDDDDYILYIHSSTGGATINLPDPATCPNREYVLVIDNNITVNFNRNIRRRSTNTTQYVINTGSAHTIRLVSILDVHGTSRLLRVVSEEVW